MATSRRFRIVKQAVGTSGQARYMAKYNQYFCSQEGSLRSEE